MATSLYGCVFYSWFVWRWMKVSGLVNEWNDSKFVMPSRYCITLRSTFLLLVLSLILNKHDNYSLWTELVANSRSPQPGYISDIKYRKLDLVVSAYFANIFWMCHSSYRPYVSLPIDEAFDSQFKKLIGNQIAIRFAV